MRILYRIIGFIHRKVKNNQAETDRKLDQLSKAFTATGPFSVISLLKHEDGDKKYVLVGNVEVLDKVEGYIKRERKSRDSVLASICCQNEKVDIRKISGGKEEYSKLVNEGDKFDLIVCAKSKAEHAKAKYQLPTDAKELKPLIKRKQIVLLRNDIVFGKDYDDYLNNNAEIVKAFGKTEIKTVSLNKNNQVTMDITHKTDLLALMTYITAIIIKIVSKK